MEGLTNLEPTTVTKTICAAEQQRVEMEEDYFTRWVPPETNYPQPRKMSANRLSHGGAEQQNCVCLYERAAVH
jgi:hypothetical protein